MAGNPKYGGTKGDLDAAIAATSANQGAINRLEDKTRKLQEAEEAEASAQNRNTGARKLSADQMERQVAALEATASRLGTETTAVNANTEAWLANARARGVAAGTATAGAREASGLGGVVPTPPPQSRLRELDLQSAGARAQLAIPVGASSAAGGAAYDATKVSSYAAAEAHAAEMAELEATARARSNDLLQQSVGSYAASSQALQRHGALTSEFVQGVARGEVTLEEFQSQLTITIGKFAGWAVAGGLVYGAYDAIKQVYNGVKETDAGVSQLKRTLGEKVNEPVAAEGFRRVASEVNVSIREVADAQFYAARVFHNQEESLELAGTALRAYKLDQVDTQDAIKSFAAISVAFSAGPKEIAAAFDQLDVGQLKFNARLNQTLPQVGRAAASYAAAGGSLKQLVDQTIEINRATGGGGGTGGGNPATALLREPANLTRPESEETLRRYGFDPKHARTHIGDFNQEVQERKFGEQANQELAKAAGGGAGVGYRYLLPLFRLGNSSLPEDVRNATSNAHGSAAEDLEHKLSQADEQVKKIGVDFEVFGSRLASLGLGPILTDVLGVVNVVVGGASALVQPFTALGGALLAIPGPLRDVIEAIVAFKGAQALSRSGVGLTARSFAAESPLLPSYVGGGAPELRNLQSTQRKYLEYLTNQREGQTLAELSSGRRAQDAGRRLDTFRQAPADVAALSSEQQDAYYAQERALQGRLIAAQQAQQDAVTSGAALEQEINGVKARLLVLEDRKLAISERLAAASEAGIYAAQGGAPNTLPLLAPRGGVERNGPLAASAERQAALGGAAAADAESAATIAAGSQGLFVVGDAALRRAGSSITGAFSGLKSFLGNLGLLGKGIAAFVALDVLNQIDGANTEFAEGASRLSNLQNPTSSAQLQEQLRKVRPNYQDAKGPGGVAEYLKATGHDLLAIPQHPIAAIESIFGGTKKPEYFSSDQREVENELARKQQKLLREGKLAGLGQGGKLNAGYVAQAEAQEFEAVGGLEAGQSGKKVEQIQSQIAAKIKLRLDELKAFGIGSYGQQAVQQLGITSSALAGKFTETGSEPIFEELSKDDETITQGIISVVQARVQSAAKLATDEAGRQAALKQAQSLLHQRATELQKPLTKSAEGIETQAELSQTLRTRLTETTDPGQRARLQKSLRESESKEAQQRSDFGKLQEKNREEQSTLHAAEEAAGKEIFTGAVTPLRAQSNLAKAKAGADKQAGAEDEVKLVIEEEAKANKYLTGADKKQELLALQAKRVQAEESVVTERIATLRAKGQREIAELPLGDNTGKAKLEVDIDKHVESLIKSSKLSPKSKAKQLEEAHTATLEAEKQAEETIEQEALAISNLDTQIAQARDQGNALAQAQDALSGAQRAAALAKTPQQKLQAQLDSANAQNQIKQAEQARVSAEGELLESRTKNPVQQAKIKVRTDRRLLAGAQGPDEAIKDRATLNNDLSRYAEAQVTNKEEDIDFHLKMNQISTQTAIDQYQSLLKTHGLAKKSRNDLLLKIRELQNEIGVGNNQVYDLAPGSIKLPTAYDVHRAISSAAHAGTLLHAGDDHSTIQNEINITVSKDGDVHKVADVIDKAMGSGVKARLRAAGVQGG